MAFAHDDKNKMPSNNAKRPKEFGHGWKSKTMTRIERRRGEIFVCSKRFVILRNKFERYGMLLRFAIVREALLSAILKSPLHVNAIDVGEPQWKEKITKEEDGRQKVQETEGRRNRARDTVRTVYVPTSLLTRCSPSQALFSFYLLFLSPSIFSFYLPFASERCASRASSLDSEERVRQRCAELSTTRRYNSPAICQTTDDFSDEFSFLAPISQSLPPPPSPPPRSLPLSWLFPTTRGDGKCDRTKLN